MTDHLLKFLEFEAEALEIRSFNIFYLHGPLQTPAYGAALTNPWAVEWDEFTQAKVDALVEARQLRRAAMQKRQNLLKYLVLVDQSVFMRPIGGVTVFADQLRQLLELSENGLFRLRMLPFDLPLPIANNGTFELLTISSEHDDGDVLYRENGVQDEMVESRGEAWRHRKRFDQLWSAADGESDTIVFLKKRIEALEGNSPEIQS
jgi:hypothetical protein